MDAPKSAARNAGDRARVRGYVAIWARAVRRQHDRITELSQSLNSRTPGDRERRYDMESEVALFLVAIRNLLRAVEWALSLEPSLQQALDRFSKDVPNAVDLRDLLEHFDAYEQGHGNLQDGKKRTKRSGRGQRSVPEVDEYAFWFEHTGTATRLLFTAGLKLEVARADKASAELANEALSALS